MKQKKSKNAKGHLYIENLDIEIPFSNEKSILEVLNKQDIEIDQSCEGMGTCGTCRILISEEKNLPERNEIELERATLLEFNDSERLACQLSPIDKIRIKIP